MGFPILIRDLLGSPLLGVADLMDDLLDLAHQLRFFTSLGKPDFLFPSKEAYDDLSFPVGKLCTLAAKTTCKDRWRQVLNEADRLRDENKYLCTMQQGISSAQMDEMQAEKVVLVVPRPYISSYPKDKRDRIWTVSRFVDYIKEIEDIT